MTRFLISVAAVALIPAVPALAQDHSGHQMPTPAPAPAPPAATAAPAMDDATMPGMDHAAMDHGAMGHGGPPAASSEGSGTSRLPGNEGGMHGLHVPLSDAWTLMIHGYASAQYTNYSGPRGDDKAYILSHAMFTAGRDTSWGHVQLRSTFSLEPLMRQDGYPSLFTTGEVAYGIPLVDRQHPHDLFIELAGRADIDIGRDTTLFVYGGPVGEPALGPSSFLHRGTAKYNPDPPITHHWFDSTHITFGVATVGVATPKLQLEGSVYTGREPDEHRFNIEKQRFDSWSLRATWTPSPSWAVQASHGFLKQPEQAHPGENERRTTASVNYANPAGFSAMAAFSAKNREPGETLTAWLAEANWDIDRHHTLFGRFENVNNDELFTDPLDPLHDAAFRVSKFEAGYAYRLPLTGPVNLALGGTVSAFAKPAALDSAYGRSPFGYTLFAKLSLGH